MTIIVVILGVLTGLAWLLPETEAHEKQTLIVTPDEYEIENPRT